MYYTSTSLLEFEFMRNKLDDLVVRNTDLNG